jgi:N-acetylglutamate synthase-like GNAT family acetyltransferase
MPVKKTMQEKQSSMKLSIGWETDRDIAKELADFFVVNVTPAYISFGEIQCGRAIDSRRWSPKFREVLLDEFKGAIKTRGNVREGRRVAVARHEGLILGIVVIGIHLKANSPHVVIEDLVVDQKKRGNGYGKEILNWVELQAAKMKAVDLFLESGITNEDAHDFFEKNGFEVVSKVMIKKVHYEK